MSDLPLDPTDNSLAEIATQWSLLRLAHHDTAHGSDAARRALLLRYSPALRDAGKRIDGFQ